MYYYGFDIYYIAFVIPALILSLYAQFKVKNAFGRYSAVLNKKGLTGANVSRKMLDINNLSDVSVKAINGNLTDNYNPSNKTVSLSESVFNSTSVAALGVAAHETGHAIQHSVGYFPLKIRSLIFPLVRISSTAAIPLAILGFILGIEQLVNIGIILFAAIVLFQVVTLPVEYNASRRALKMLKDYGMLEDEEIASAKKVLNAALASVANLLRLILLSRNRRN